MNIFEHLLSAASAAPACESVEAWWPGYIEIARAWPTPIDRAMAGGHAADRLGWAFASGYQAALRALVSDLPEDTMAALCVTEAEGNTPRAIRSSLQREGDGFVLDGSKRWTTLGPSGALFLVAARDEAACGERVALRVARVASTAPGVHVESMPPTRFVPEVPHAQLRFDRVRVAADDLLPGDGYDLYVKRFRTVEDLHVNAAMLAYLVHEAERLGWPPDWIERTVAVLRAARALALDDPAKPAVHISLAGVLALGRTLVAEGEREWAKTADDPGYARWQRDRELLGVASKARALRTERAWERLRSGQLARRWQALCADPTFEDVAGKIELTERGEILVTPVGKSHGIAAMRVAESLRKALGGQTMAEVGVATSIGVRAPDVAWCSESYLAAHPEEMPLSSAPELCVEIVSASNALPKLREKAMAYVVAGAVEAWIVYPQSRQVEIYGSEGRRDATSFAVDTATLFA